MYRLVFRYDRWRSQVDPSGEPSVILTYFPRKTARREPISDFIKIIISRCDTGMRCVLPKSDVRKLITIYDGCILLKLMTTELLVDSYVSLVQRRDQYLGSSFGENTILIPTQWPGSHPWCMINSVICITDLF